CHAPAIGSEHCHVGPGRVLFHPLEQGGSEIEAHRAERWSYAGVTFVLDALIPIVERRGVRLDGNGSGPGVVARWLVEMPVDDDGSLQPARAASQNASSRGASRFHVHAVRSLSHMEWSPFAPQDPSASCNALRGGCASRCCDAITARTPFPRNARYVAARKSVPSNHQCPN